MSPDPQVVEKNPQNIAALLHSVAEIVASYGISETRIPQSQSTLAPLDMATIHPAVKICKIDEDEQLVFGWASISADEFGGLVVDSDNEVIEPDVLEKAVYQYVLEERGAGELHEGESIGQMVESLVVTPEKAKAMGLTVPLSTGWWFGVKIHDADVFAKVKDGTYSMFSIGGTAVAEEVEVA